MQIDKARDGSIQVHQGYHAEKLMAKYSIVKKSDTPLSSVFTGEDYVSSGVSKAVSMRQYQEIVGDVTWLTLTRFDIMLAVSKVAQKTHYASERDYSEVMRILEYVNSYVNMPLIYHRAPVEQRVPLREILGMPVGIFCNGDCAHGSSGRPGEPRDQTAYFVRIFSVCNAAIDAVSKVNQTTLASTEGEVATQVKGVCSEIDVYFILNHIGFTNIAQMIYEGDA